jgi:hypothetical protein
MLACGCDARTGPPPAQGYQSEPVSYEPAPIPNPVVVSLQRTALPGPADSPVSIEVAEPLVAGEGLAFEGVIEVPDPEQAGGVIHVEFSQPESAGRPRIITQTGQQLVSWKESPVGHIHYRIDTTAPRESGTHDVVITLMHRGPDLLTIGKGEVEIQRAE